MGTLGCINDMQRRDKENRELRKLGRERIKRPVPDSRKLVRVQNCLKFRQKKWKKSKERQKKKPTWTMTICSKPK